MLLCLRIGVGVKVLSPAYLLSGISGFDNFNFNGEALLKRQGYAGAKQGQGLSGCTKKYRLSIGEGRVCVFSAICTKLRQKEGFVTVKRQQKISELLSISNSFG
ncbi:hypothetical protein [Candidatus Pantoea multigeneris]|uniref:Uncharacterized protein n=1 Tax=Candidatus Pantoea multigeneris TaxID=2608357 RepID=A0ABX0RGY0_9GAMM|nr:hypothetical protein [Pantoea multigeneris]NIF22694.1 hypothetical protein [Pantoea multigeneris]